MDGREGMTLRGSGPYYLYRGIDVGAAAGGSSGSGDAAHTAFNPPSGFRHLPNPSAHQVPSNFRSVSSGGSSTFNVDGSPASFLPHGFTMTTVASASDGGGGGEVGESSNRSEPVKKKRGRPRKYGPDGSAAGVDSGAVSGAGAVSLGLSPLSAPEANASAERPKRGRPPGSGRKQRLASVGKWMSSSAGHAFTTHVIFVDPGEDIALKILSFAQLRPRALCIMSGSGGVSAVTLRQPASSVGNVTYEGRFDILCFSGSYLVAETGGARNRTGGVNVSLLSQDRQVIGGSVAGRLIASRPVQVVVCTFIYENPNAADPEPRMDSDANGKNNSSEHHTGNNLMLGHANPSSSKHMNPNIDIDLMRG